MPNVGRGIQEGYRHFSRKLQHQVAQLGTTGGGLPPDLLMAGDVGPQFCGQTGFPDAADSVAYESVQSLLAVGAAICRQATPSQRHGFYRL